MGLLQDKLSKFRLPQLYMERGVYPYFREIDSHQDTEVIMDGKKVLMFGSNSYMGLTYDERIIEAAIAATRKYVQGAGEMKKLGEYAQKYGKKALVLITESGYKRIGDVVNTGFEGYEITPVYEYFNRECSKNEINRLVDIMNETC